MTIFPTLPNAVLWLLSVSEREHKETSYVQKKGKYLSDKYFPFFVHYKYFSKMAENEELLSYPINLPLILSLNNF